MTTDAQPFDGQFEPPAESVAQHNPAIPLSEIALASIAISLKRLADKLERPSYNISEAVDLLTRRGLQP